MATNGQPELPELPPPQSSQVIHLPAGKPLGEAEASEVLRASLAPIVVLAGPVKSGKTTLLASIHDSFQWHPFAGFLAAGSETLIGYEECCFDSRAASGAEIPTTVRTKIEEGHLFYHLKIRKEDLATPIQHLLLADMSGEFYERAIDSATEMRSLTIIRRADHFVHLIDGANLISGDLRAHTESNALMLMRRCFEESMLAPEARVDVLLTKWDIVLTRCGEEDAAERFDFYRNLFDERFGKKVARLRVARIAARPHYRSALPLGFGLADLLRCWVEESPGLLQSRLRPLPVSRFMRRPFEVFATREAPEIYETPDE